MSRPVLCFDPGCAHERLCLELAPGDPHPTHPAPRWGVLRAMKGKPVVVRSEEPEALTAEGWAELGELPPGARLVCAGARAS